MRQLRIKRELPRLHQRLNKTNRELVWADSIDRLWIDANSLDSVHIERIKTAFQNPLQNKLYDKFFQICLFSDGGKSCREHYKKK